MIDPKVYLRAWRAVKGKNDVKAEELWLKYLNAAAEVENEKRRVAREAGEYDVFIPSPGPDDTPKQSVEKRQYQNERVLRHLIVGPICSNYARSAAGLNLGGKTGNLSALRVEGWAIKTRPCTICVESDDPTDGLAPPSHAMWALSIPFEVQVKYVRPWGEGKADGDPNPGPPPVSPVVSDPTHGRDSGDPEVEEISA